MSLLMVLSMYKATDICAPIAKGIKGHYSNAMLDCDCVDCGTSADCSNCDAPGTTH